MELGSTGDLSNLELNLSCRGGRCSPDVQPGATCGGAATVHCPTGLYCSFDVGALCGAYVNRGVCAVKPDACTRERAPMCGCDGRTYGNRCEAAADGASIKSEGECGPPIVEVGESSTVSRPRSGVR